MNLNRKNNSESQRPQLYPARNLSEVGARLGLDAKPAPWATTSSATWPTGVSLLAQMVDACQRCDTADVCTEWLARAPQAIASPPAFCPNADTLKRAKRS